MCPPQFFEIDYEINPWMHKENPVDHNLALKEWESLKSIYLDLSLDVEVIEPVKGWPDMVFTANAGLTIGREKFLLSRFRFPQRRGEEPFFRRWFEDRGWEIIQPKFPFEGQGEAFIWNGKLLAGYGFRSNEDTVKELKSLLDIEVIPLKLVNPKFYHVDMALAPINKNLIVYNPKAFDKDSVQKIRSLDCEKIEVIEGDANLFGCNLVPVGKTIVMVSGTQKLAEDFRSRGFKTVELNMSEFRKSGGAIRCLTLDLD